MGDGGINYKPCWGPAPQGELASASPVKAYCCPVSKMINVTERSGGARTLAKILPFTSDGRPWPLPPLPGGVGWCLLQVPLLLF